MNACPVDTLCGPEVSADETGSVCVAARLNRLSLWPQVLPLPGGDEGAFPQVAAAPVFVAAADRQRMAQAVHALHELLASPAWAAHALAQAPAIAGFDPGNAGVLYGFDFHLTAEGPKLIEINTNAGGALISTAVMRLQNRCCGAVADPVAEAAAAEQAILDSFLTEWRMVRDTAGPRRVAIVDEGPGSQYLREEFRLFARLFQSAGVEAVICDPRELEGGAGGLSHRGQPVDMVYNRLTDFYLDAPALAPLREAYLGGAVVLSPHPRGHALFADKRHLARLCDPDFLSAMGMTALQQAAILDVAVPTRIVGRAQAEALWRERRSLYFKPVGAFGGRGAYEGAKLTRTTFERLLDEDYVAQAYVPAPRRRVFVDAMPAELKYDVRCYVYRGDIQLLAARLYRGQATNFRTAGGGFATVHVVPN
ncbi:MAG: hypothetical protein AB7U81_14835 [Thiohalomonadaceae bacterium]